MTETKFNRRSFLSAAAAAFALDPDRLLWIRGAKVYSIPKPQPIVPMFRFDLPLTIHPIIRVSSISFDIQCGGHSILEPGDPVEVSFAGEIPRLFIFKWMDNGRIHLEERSLWTQD